MNRFEGLLKKSRQQILIAHCCREILESAGSYVNAGNERNFSRTQLHRADGNDNREFLAFLISKGADIFIKNRLSVKPLDSFSGKEMTDFFSYYGLPFDDSY